MKKKKSLIFKLASVLMICCMSLLFVGCGLSPLELLEIFQDDDNAGLGGDYDPADQEELDFDMYGT